MAEVSSSPICASQPTSRAAVASGLEAQREAVARYLNGGRWKLLAEYVEVESGKRNSRPQLQAAISHAKATGAKLVIARLDRLARNLHFVSSLQERGVDFVAADMPDANRLTIHIIAAVAESVGRTISENTRTALAALRRVGSGSAILTAPGRSEEGRLAMPMPSRRSERTPLSGRWTSKAS